MSAVRSVRVEVQCIIGWYKSTVVKLLTQLDLWGRAK